MQQRRQPHTNGDVLCNVNEAWGKYDESAMMYDDMWKCEESAKKYDVGHESRYLRRVENGNCALILKYVKRIKIYVCVCVYC